MDATPPAAALETLLAHRAWVRRVARALSRDESAADDLEQAAWAAALESPPRTDASPRAWLGTVLRRAAARVRRTEDRRRRREEAVARPEAGASVADRVAEAEAHERVVRAVLALPEPYRGTIVLRYFDDLPPREIAARTQTTADTVQTRLRRGRELLRAALTEERRDWPAALGPLLAGPAAPRVRRWPRAAAASAAAVALVVAVAVVVAARSSGVDGASARERRGAGAATAGDRGTDPAPDRVRPRTRRAAPGETGTESSAERDEPSAPTRRAEVRVVHQGRPVPGARVLAYAGGVTHASVTAQDGSVAFDLGEPLWVGCGLLVLAPGHAPVVAAATVPGATVVTLPSRDEVSGVLRVDGGAPGVPVTLTFGWFEPAPDLAGIDARVWEAASAGDPGASPTTVSVTTDAEGRFVGHLPAGELGVAVPDPFEWTDGSKQLAVGARRRGLTLEARRLASIRGRVVGTEGRAEAFARIVVTALRADGVPVRSTRGADADGRFEFAWDPEDGRPVRLTVAGDDGAGARSVDAPATAVQGWDAGDVAIAPSRVVPVVVRDVEGRPVERAVPRHDAEISGPVHGTDASGRGTVNVPVGPSRIRVSAAGFAVAEVEVPAGSAAVTVTLTRAPRLSLDVAGAVEGWNVRVTAASLVFSGRGGRYDSALADAECAYPHTARYEDDGSTTADFALADPRLVIDGLRDGVPFTLTVLDATGFPAARAEVRLAPAETREVALVPVPAPRRLAGRLRRADGSPAAGATLYVASPAGRLQDAAEATTDGEGRFGIDGVCAPEVRVLAEDDGGAALDAVRPLPAPGDDLVLDLPAAEPAAGPR